MSREDTTATLPPSLRRASGLTAFTCAVLALALPLLAAGYWLAASPDALLQGARLVRPAGAQFENWQRIASLPFATASVLLFALALTRARRCFVRFSQGATFDSQVVEGLRGAAGALAASAAAGLLAPSAISVLLSWNFPAGQRQLMVGLDSAHLLALLAAGMLWIIASVMARGVVLAEENARFV